LDRKNLRSLHVPWLAATAVLTVLSILWYGWAAWNSQRWPGGGSSPGLAFGIAAGAICLFECALLLRRTKWLRTKRWLLSAQIWMKAHIWLGLLAIPLVAMHSGFAFGGTLSSLLAWLFIAVIASGIFGLVMQNILPRMLLHAVPEETVHSQIDVVSRQLAEDAQRLARVYEEGDRGGDGNSRPEEKRSGIGMARRVGTMAQLARNPANELRQGSAEPELVQAVRAEILPFLRTGVSANQRLASPQRIGWYFDDLRARVKPASRAAVDEVERLCERRRQLNLQQRIHGWLHGWLLVHVPLSAALLVLLFAHVIAALWFN
jgi:hypothetical protein